MVLMRLMKVWSSVMLMSPRLMFGEEDEAAKMSSFVGDLGMPESLRIAGKRVELVKQQSFTTSCS